MARDPYAPLTLENVFRVEMQIYFVLRFLVTGKVRKSKSKPKNSGTRDMGSVVW